jgi:hypothetical protein
MPAGGWWVSAGTSGFLRQSLGDGANHPIGGEVGQALSAVDSLVHKLVHTPGTLGLVPKPPPRNLGRSTFNPQSTTSIHGLRNWAEYLAIIAVGAIAVPFAMYNMRKGFKRMINQMAQ